MVSNKVVVFADTSYTIRRITELAFSDEKEIELLFFENGNLLCEKLAQIKVDIVLVDIKLPDIDGYDICKIVNRTEHLKHIPVILLKGAFEFLDEPRLKDLRFAEIITKPFDSQALVGMVKNYLKIDQIE